MSSAIFGLSVINARGSFKRMPLSRSACFIRSGLSMYLRDGLGGHGGALFAFVRAPGKRDEA